MKFVFTYIFDDIAYQITLFGYIYFSYMYTHQGKYIIQWNIFGPHNS